MKKKFRLLFYIPANIIIILLIGILISNQLSANNKDVNRIIFEDDSTYLSLVVETVSYNISENSTLFQESYRDFPMSVYTVKRNDNFYNIAKKLNTDISTIYSLNNIKQDGNFIMPGEKYVVLKGKKGILHKVSKGETIEKIAESYSKYGVTIDEILAENDIREGENIRVGENIYIPGVKLSNKELIERSNPKWVLPIRRSRSYITSEFSRWRTVWINGRKYSGPHKGIDISNKGGTGVPIYATRSGVVTFVGYKTGYGKIVYINHGDGFQSRYAHLYKYLVKKGQRVNQGQMIAKMGNTGRSTGPHLHFEIRYRGVAKNPRKYVSELSGIRRK